MGYGREVGRDKTPGEEREGNGIGVWGGIGKGSGAGREEKQGEEKHNTVASSEITGANSGGKRDVAKERVVKGTSAGQGKGM